MASEITPLINGTEYAWASIRVNLFGRTVAGITAVEYSQETTKTNVYGAGNQPVARSRGNKSPTGSMTIHLTEYNAIVNALPSGKGPEDIAPFSITVTYEEEGKPLVTHVLESVEFTNHNISQSQNSESVSVELGLIIGSIKYN